MPARLLQSTTSGGQRPLGKDPTIHTTKTLVMDDSGRAPIACKSVPYPGQFPMAATGTTIGRGGGSPTTLGIAFTNARLRFFFSPKKKL